MNNETRMWRYLIPLMNLIVAFLFLSGVHFAFVLSLNWASPSIDSRFWADVIVYGFVIYMIIFQNNTYTKRYGITVPGNKTVLVENRLTFGLMPKFRELHTGYHYLWVFEHTYSRDGKETKSEIDHGSITCKVKNDDGFQLAHGQIAVPGDMVLVWHIKNPTMFAKNFRMKDATLRLASEIETFLREEFRNAPDHDSLRAITNWCGRFKHFLRSSSTIENDMGIVVEDFKIGDIDLSIIEQKAESAGIAAKAISKSVAKCYNEMTGRNLSADLATANGVNQIALKIAQDTVQGQTVDFKKIQTDSGKGTVIELNEGK